MTSFLKSSLGACGIDARALYQGLSARSVDAAVAEQNLSGLVDRLCEVVPDISDQYTATTDELERERYWERKTRALHAFQVSCALDALEQIGGSGRTVVDIGDSSGNHAAYIRALAPAGAVGRFVSINLDPVAIEKIRKKSGEALLSRAEDLRLNNVHPDLIISFETFEHLFDPVRFMHSLATEADAEHLLFTVPYRRQSRFGGHLIRYPLERIPDSITPETVHLLELSPSDWTLAAWFSGFRTVFSRIYLQYPRRSPLRLMAPIWRRYDCEGFAAFFLVRDLSLAKRYTGW